MVWNLGTIAPLGYIKGMPRRVLNNEKRIVAIPTKFVSNFKLKGDIAHNFLKYDNIPQI